MTEDAPSQSGMKLQFYCSALYDRMASEAITLTDEGAASAIVWQGRIIETAKSLGIPEGSYKRVVDKLRALGCVEQATRGFRGISLSGFILHYPPTPERWEAQENDPRRLTGAPNFDRLSADVRDIQTRLGGLNYTEAFAEIDRRLTALEAIVPKEDNAKK